MIVLGLSGVFGHDPAACVVRDGTVVAAAEEERFTRLKHGFGQVPLHSAHFCLKRAGITLSDVDRVAASWNPALAPVNDTLRNYLGWLFDRLDAFRGQRIPPVEYIDHHLAHAASAYFGSGFPEAAILVVDGTGEIVATSLGVGRGTNLRIETAFSARESLGQFYRSASEFAGFPGFSEGKFMGLAAYGQIRDVSAPFSLTQDGYQSATDWPSWLRTHFGCPNHIRYGWDEDHGRLTQVLDLPDWCRDLAATAQHHLEKVLVHLAETATTRAGCRSLVIAGGVGLNCAANGAIWRSGLVDRLYVYPAAHDAGGAVGAAMWVAAQTDKISHPPSADLGPRFSRAAVVATLRRLGIRFEEPADLVDRVADLLVNGQVIGWFEGGMEFGPRALGRRSILAWPSSTEIRDRVNRIKGRELWRPLAPSILEEESERLLGSGGPFSFMLVATQATEVGQFAFPAAVHVDGTVRAQTVPVGYGRYADLLSALKRRTGIGVVLNTSFNLEFEPIVCTPADALRTFFSSELDALMIEGLLVSKYQAVF